MIIDNLKEFMTKLSGTRQKNNDCHEEETETETSPCIPDDEIDEPIPDVYGPAPGYDDDLDTCAPDAEDIIEKKDAQE